MTHTCRVIYRLSSVSRAVFRRFRTTPSTDRDSFRLCGILRIYIRHCQPTRAAQSAAPAPAQLLAMEVSAQNTRVQPSLRLR